MEKKLSLADFSHALSLCDCWLNKVFFTNSGTSFCFNSGGYVFKNMQNAFVKCAPLSITFPATTEDSFYCRYTKRYQFLRKQVCIRQILNFDDFCKLLIQGKGIEITEEYYSRNEVLWIGYNDMKQKHNNRLRDEIFLRFRTEQDAYSCMVTLRNI